MSKNIAIEHITMGKDAKNSAYLSVMVPENVCKLQVKLRYTTQKQSQLPFALFDPHNTLRGIAIYEFSRGKILQTLWTGIDRAGRGAVPGSIEAGNWKILLYTRYLSEEVNCTVTVSVKEGLPLVQRRLPERNTTPIQRIPAWYCGELHMHSKESTGRSDVATLIAVAAQQKLDFIAITDHWSISHWQNIDALSNGRRPLVIHSCELSGERGHANLHGVSRWIPPFIDLDSEVAQVFDLENHDMNAVADAVHEMGGIFCINHPLSGRVAWRYDNFLWEKADLIEVVGLPDGPNSFLYPVFWDRLLCEGYRITAVGSSDSHDPLSEGPWKLGKIRNWVFAEELSEAGLMRALRRGTLVVSLGNTKMDFVAQRSSTEETSVGIGETLHYKKGDVVVFTISVMNHPKGFFYIIKDGLIFDVIFIEKADTPHKWSSTSFTSSLSVSRTTASYIRVEFHEEIVAPYYEGMAYRDHYSLRTLSNPIYLQITE